MQRNFGREEGLQNSPLTPRQHELPHDTVNTVTTNDRISLCDAAVLEVQSIVVVVVIDSDQTFRGMKSVWWNRF